MDKIDVRIEQSFCKECGICLHECPHHQNEEGHNHVDHSYEFCDRCLHCYAVCPQHAISIEQEAPLPERGHIEAEKLISHLMYRRSYRRFLDKPVPRDTLNHLLTAARYIPSGGNDHRMNITVLTSQSKRQELLPAIYGYYHRILKLLKNPALQFIARRFGDPKVKATLNDPFNYKKIVNAIQQMDSADDAVFYHAPAVFFFHTDRIMPTAKEDCILSAYNIVLLSETLGLGSCFVSLSQQAVTNDKTCKRILGIPETHRVEAVVVVGYPKRFYQRPAYRFPKTVQYV